VDVAHEPGRFISRDITHSEQIEKELDTFISKRHDQRVAAEGGRPAEAAWRESERRVAARRRLEESLGRLEWANKPSRGVREAHRGIYASHRDHGRRLVRSIEYIQGGRSPGPAMARGFMYYLSCSHPFLRRARRERCGTSALTRAWRYTLTYQAAGVEPGRRREGQTIVELARPARTREKKGL